MTYTIKDIVARYTVTERTVLVWIRSGDLKAINVGRSLAKKKPRWRITERALNDFELLRASQTPIPPRRRRKKDPNVTQYY